MVRVEISVEVDEVLPDLDNFWDIPILREPDAKVVLSHLTTVQLTPSMSRSASARRLHALVGPNCGQIFAQRICSLGIWRAASNVAPPDVEIERVRAGLETRYHVAGAPDGG